MYCPRPRTKRRSSVRLTALPMRRLVVLNSILQEMSVYSGNIITVQVRPVRLCYPRCPPWAMWITEEDLRLSARISSTDQQGTYREHYKCSYGIVMAIASAGRIGTEVELISTLIAGISKGEIKVPKFQRNFVWKDTQALDLLDSVANNYPVGSLLLWRTKEKLLAERNFGEFSLPATDDMEPTDYVLDGQQRLTVIYSCLGAKESDGGFSVVYDIEAQKFLRTPENPRLTQFPLRKMFNTTQLLNFRAAIQTASNGPLY